MSYADKVFVAMCQDILENGTSTEGELVRPHWEDGTSAYTIKKFGVVNRYDLSKEFPAITLRKTYIKSQRIDLCSIPKSKSNSPHRLAISETLIGQVAIAISCIRRVCIILSDCHSGNHREQKRTKCVFKSYHYYSLKFYLILSTLKIYLQR